MEAESVIQRLAMILVDETGCDEKKALQEILTLLEIAKDLDPNLSQDEWFGSILKKTVGDQEKRDVLKAKFLAADLTHDFEENFRTGIRIGKEVFSDN